MDHLSKSQAFEERLIQFSEAIIELCNGLPKTITTNPIISQIIRSATSIGANYSEANNACSRKDFKNKIFICKKEAQETKYWLRLLLKASNQSTDKIKLLLEESSQFCLIFQKIVSTMEAKSENGK